MGHVVLLALVMAAPQASSFGPPDQEAQPRFAASLPCVPVFMPMGWRQTAPQARVDRRAPPARPPVPQRPPCFRRIAG